jgi:hypothetical protein
MRTPPWNFAPISQKEKVKARLERERAELGIVFDFGTEEKTTLVGGKLVTVAAFKWRQLPTPVSERPLCGARTKAGTPCRRRVAIKASGDWGKRCSKHGGLSTGPKTPEGRAAVSAAVARSNRTRRADAPASSPIFAFGAPATAPAPPSLMELARRELERRARLSDAAAKKTL